MTDLHNLFQEIAKVRKSKGLSQERLAAMVGKNQAFLSIIEKPDFADTVFKIREILRIGVIDDPR